MLSISELGSLIIRGLPSDHMILKEATESFQRLKLITLKSLFCLDKTKIFARQVASRYSVSFQIRFAKENKFQWSCLSWVNL